MRHLNACPGDYDGAARRGTCHAITAIPGVVHDREGVRNTAIAIYRIQTQAEGVKGRPK